MHKAWKWTAATAALAAALGTNALAAEGGVPEALSGVNRTLNALIATVNQLAGQVNALATAIGTPTGPAAYLVTSPVQAGNNAATPSLSNDRVICFVHNASAAPARVTITFLDGTGATAKVDTVDIPPGGSALSGLQYGVYACKFTSETTPLRQLRANAAVRSRATGSLTALSEAR